MGTNIVATGTLAADIATNGTLAISYPTQNGFAYSKGHFENAGPTDFYVNGSPYKEPHDYTTSYGATAVTLTYTGTTTLKAGSRFTFGFRRSGVSGNRPFNSIRNRLTAELAPLWKVNLGSPATASSTAIATSQSVTGVGTAFVLNGALLSGTQIVMDVPRNVVAAWTNTAILTITGYDEANVLMIEKTASGTSHTGKKAFKRITSITTNASITGATVGTGNVLGLPVTLIATTQIYGEMLNGVNIAPPPRFVMTGQINQTDLLASTTQNLVCPFAGFIAAIRGVCQVAVTTGGTIQAKVGTTNVTGCVFTVANADPVGTLYSATPTTLRSATTAVAAGSRIQMTPASFATAGAVNYEIEIETLRSMGTIVVADLGANTATSGDVRGTYLPTTVPDGSTSYELILSLPDPSLDAPLQWSA